MKPDFVVFDATSFLQVRVFLILNSIVSPCYLPYCLTGELVLIVNMSYLSIRIVDFFGLLFNLILLRFNRSLVILDYLLKIE